MHQNVLAQIDALLEEWEAARTASPYDDFSGGLPEYQLQAIATRLSAAISRYAPPGSEYAKHAAAVGGHIGYLVKHLGGILQALRADIEAGYMQTFEEIVHADVFADFLDMARELHSKGYKDAAAVIAGSVLEEHLRKLAARTGIEAEKLDGSPKKADTLNAELAKADAYNKLVQKSVTAWLDLRNKAAHGEYDEYDHQQVAALIRDVLDFTTRHPA